MIGILLLWMTILLLIFILIKLFNIKKNFIFCFLITLVIILFAINVETSMKAAIEGAKLMFTAVFPTVFPFAVICNLLIYYNGIDLYSRILGPIFCKPLGLSQNSSFPIIASVICGYPLGAKFCHDTFKMGYIEKTEYERLLNIASNAGPIFLLGTVGTAMLGSVKYGYILLLANYLSIFFVGFLTKKKGVVTISQSRKPVTTSQNNLGTNLKMSIENALNTTFIVSAYVILFSIVIALIKSSSNLTTCITFLETLFNITPGTLYSVFLGSIEMTNGCKLVSNTLLSIHLKLSIISFLCSFSGFSVIGQISSFISEDNISLFKYSILKFVQGILSFGITFCASKFFITSTEVSTISPTPIINSIYHFLPIMAFIILTLICIFINSVVKMLHTS